VCSRSHFGAIEVPAAVAEFGVNGTRCEKDLRHAREPEASQAFEELDRILKGHGLSWVSDQVREEIRLGKLQEKQVETLKRCH